MPHHLDDEGDGYSLFFQSKRDFLSQTKLTIPVKIATM